MSSIRYLKMCCQCSVQKPDWCANLPETLYQHICHECSWSKLKLCLFLIFVAIDDYAKDGGPGEVWLLCSFYHEALRTGIETNVNRFTISNHTALKLDVLALRSCLSLICEYELYILPNKKVSIAKNHGKNYMKDRPPWSAIFCVIVCWLHQVRNL